MPPTGMPALLRSLEQHAVDRGTCTAIVDESGETGYARLWTDAYATAQALREALVSPGDIVVVAADRGASFITAALGCWLAGAVYLPVAQDSPPERVRRTVANSHARVALCGTTRTDAVASTGVERIDIPLTPRDAPIGPPVPMPTAAAGLAPDDPAYLIYTSGSTGEPKGVLVSHAALANLVDWHVRAYAVSSQDRALHTASLGFDAAVWEIWPYLAVGATVIACPDEDRSVADFAASQLADQRCTIAFLATPLAEELIRLAPELPRLRYLLTGGDTLRLPGPHPGPWQLVNHYGPTEASVVTTAYPVDASETGIAPPIGRAISGVRTLLLNADRRPVPEGAEGEIFVGGRGLALGYFGDSEQTTARFVPVPGESGLWYRTGDLATSAGGVLTFRRRADLEQLKVRGVRIEAAEIEAALMACPGVEAAAVTMLHGGTDGVLVAAVAAPLRLTPEQLRSFLCTRLPIAVLPNRYVFVDRLPLTENGKLDRRRIANLATATGTPPSPVTGEHLANS